MKTLQQTSKQVDPKVLEQKVKHMYREVALHPEISYHFEMGRDLAERLGYPAALLDKIPAAAIDSFAGVGYHFDLADLKPGEKIVDMGSGSGMDAFFAANQIGPNGHVTGIDMTPEQLEKSTALRNQHGFTQVHFKESYIESLPLESASVDAVISNGVINLSTYKELAFEEAARVLKPGGRLAISDIVSMEALPEKIKNNVNLWASCIGGAVQIDDYLGHVAAAGFNIVQVKYNPYSFISKGALGATRDYGIKSISVLAIK